jgi:hypothetical protein
MRWIVRTEGTREPLLPQSLVDGIGPIALVAVLADLARSAAPFFQFGLRALGVVRGTGAVVAVHPVEALALGSFDPVDHGAGTHAKAASHGPDGLVLTNGSHQLATTLSGMVCLLMMISSGQRVFRYCSPLLFGMY